MENDPKVERQVFTMLKMQDKVNSIIDENWLDKDNSYTRAAYRECVEALESIPWKWWKGVDQKADYENLKVEMIDIYHFFLCDTLKFNYDVAVGNWGKGHFNVRSSTLGGAVLLERITVMARFKANSTMENKPELRDNDYLTLKLEQLTQYLLDATLNGRNIDTRQKELFIDIWTNLGFDFEDLYTGYVTKNVLNQFRQSHGYKEGTYLKVWKTDTYETPQEDNVYAFELSQSLKGDIKLESKLLALLEVEYNKALKSH